MDMIRFVKDRGSSIAPRFDSASKVSSCVEQFSTTVFDSRSFPKNLLSAATVCAPAGEATPQRAIRVIHGSVPVSRAPHLHAGPCGARVPALEVAQVHVVSQPPCKGRVFGYPSVKSFVLWHIIGLIASFSGKLLFLIPIDYSSTHRLRC